MVANSIISLPYYFAFLLWQGEPERIIRYCSQPTHPLLPFSLLFAIALAFASEYTGSERMTQPTRSACASRPSRRPRSPISRTWS